MGSPSQQNQSTASGRAAGFPVLPDYRGSCLSNVVPALLGPPDAAEWLPAPVREAKTVVLLLIDGMGWEQLQDRVGLTPVLSAMEGGAITTVARSGRNMSIAAQSRGAPALLFGESCRSDY